MKPLVIAATALALVTPAYAQTTPAPADKAAQEAAATAETAAETASDAAEQAEDQAEERNGAAARQAADTAAEAADDAADAAAMSADDAATAAGAMGEDAADTAADAADKAENAASDAADAASDAADTAQDAAPVTPPDVKAPMISEADPGLLASWLTSRRIWTTNQPSTSEWTQPESLDERPSDWQDIAKVSDIVLDDSGRVVGYIADIGGFLGIGAKKVLLGVDALHMVTVGNDTFFATNYTKEELEALPDFDEKTVRK